MHFRRRFRLEFVNPFKPEDEAFCHSSVAFFYLDDAARAAPEIPETDTLLCWYRLRERDHQSIP